MAATLAAAGQPPEAQIVRTNTQQGPLAKAVVMPVALPPPCQEQWIARTSSQQAVLRWHEQGRKELSVGLELECFLPDLGALVPDRLVPVEEKGDLFKLVAETLTQRLRSVDGAGMHRCRAAGDRCVSAEPADWGRLWTATGDGSIQPQGANPFPVEIVSKRMRFEEFDVTLFCDVVHALRSPPLKAATNESTGLHVHLGKYPGFFSAAEVASILKAYLLFEPAINRLLPITRQRNRFCLDLREVLARAAGFGETASNSELFARIDGVVASIRGLSPAGREALLTGCRGAVAKGQLLVALLGEGTIWRTKVALDLRCAQGLLQRAPAGMVLHGLSHGGKVLWRRPSGDDLRLLWGDDGASGDSSSEIPTPWDVLAGLDDEQDIECLLRVPDEVPPESLDLWLLRDGLILDRHGMRYCKLNIMRIALPSDRATLEFRQFPGGDFNQTLLIWGWVKFLALLVTHACAAGSGVLGAELPAEGTEQALKQFLQLSSDTMLLAWYRDVQNRLPNVEAALSTTRTDWQWLWTQWVEAAKKTDGRSLMAACGLWRRIFQAAAGMRPIFAPSDGIWEPLERYKKPSADFMQRLYRAHELRLRAYIQHLRAAEEVSRVASLPTVVRLVLDGGRLRDAYGEVRMLQATIAETSGWDACEEALVRSIAELSHAGAELTLDHARNLLAHCERGAAGLRGIATVLVETEAQRKALLQGLEDALPGDGPLRLGPACKELAGVPVPAGGAELLPAGPLQAVGSSRASKRAWLEALAAAQLPIELSLRLRGSEAPAALPLLRRAYHELCSWLLVPRAEEARSLWAGLRLRGWTPARIRALNGQMQQAGQHEAWALAASWFGRAARAARPARSGSVRGPYPPGSPRQLAEEPPGQGPCVVEASRAAGAPPLIKLL